MTNVSYSKRVVEHVMLASQDKNVQPRTFSSAWVKALIRKHKSQIEHTGLDSFEKILKKGLTDANPKVREAYRSTYWTFALVWPQKAEAYVYAIAIRYIRSDTSIGFSTHSRNGRRTV